MCNFSVSTVPADGRTPLGAGPSAGTVMTKLGSGRCSIKILLYFLINERKKNKTCLTDALILIFLEENHSQSVVYQVFAWQLKISKHWVWFCVVYQYSLTKFTVCNWLDSI